MCIVASVEFSGQKAPDKHGAQVVGEASMPAFSLKKPTPQIAQLVEPSTLDSREGQLSQLCRTAE